MKPRAFIGSSVEGLDTAYAIQQNLLHDVESTVWDQGVFELSSTTIESLTEALTTTDFAIFVFSPDDETKMRGKETATVRDNVLFELGLFIGKLGRERVFFVMPSGTEMHIPTDLLGVTPGKFDPNREDGKLQAATGPVCHQIRSQIKSLGKLSTEKGKPVQLEDSKSEDPTDAWVSDFVNGNYASAETKINEKIASAPEKEKAELLPFTHYIAFKKKNTGNASDLIKFASEHPTDKYIQKQVAQFLLWERHIGDAINLINNLGDDVKNDPQIKSLLAECHVANGDADSAKTTLSDGIDVSPELAIQLALVHENADDNTSAFNVTRLALLKNPSNESLRYKCARYASEIGEHKIAAYLLKELTNDFQKSESYWGYLGNCCVSLDFYDQALAAYRRAESISNGKADWINSNIGNVLFFNNFPSEAISYLKKAIEINEDSEYAHDRLSKSLSAKKEQDKILNRVCDEGKILLKNWATPEHKAMPSQTLLSAE
ncbi:nucleotide-binding protein [Burkholderia cenocepacia]|uniref:TIR domain-containing protein n=1 Tax=Burkholderia cepacia complex TaxID=87882 RepID=UPI001B9F5830|nr:MULTISPECIES: TIR domain-containing protein [Burkholderia cepacia complex]ELW9448952.1 nucleotide-binding protein [Burkholderia cenocepacia]MBR8483935.1 nucleotide-binding protein [Burkholderia cenocepacia]MDN7471722.1 nucleotide-binding protein [Burkholderia orbicola]MDN7504649.1 nucleotide-binding protein [Burkholderia orbicola]